MTATNPESKCAGLWKPIEMTDGDIVKLFQSGAHGENNYRQFDGKWYILDESPEGLKVVEDFYRYKIKKELLDKYPDLTLEL